MNDIAAARSVYEACRMDGSLWLGHNHMVQAKGALERVLAHAHEDGNVDAVKVLHSIIALLEVSSPHERN